jgi:serine/threonine protein kinase
MEATMNSGEIALTASDCNQKSKIKVIHVFVSPGDLIAPDKPIMEVLTTTGESVPLRSPRSGSVTRCPVARDGTIGPDEPLLFLTPTDIETDEANLQTVGLEEPVFVAQNRVPFTITTGDLSDSDIEVLENRDSDSNGHAPTKQHAVREVETLYLPVDQDNKPRKIGDGSYSIVFEAENINSDKRALKVLYDRDTKHADISADPHPSLNTMDVYRAEYWVARERFKAECRSMKDIRRAIAERGKLRPLMGIEPIIKSEPYIDSIVNHIGHTVNLSEELSSIFKSTGLKLSNLGLVTDLYDGTLKDLLEKPRKQDQKVTGYEILRLLKIKDRVRSILPFIHKIADGLGIMHEAGYVHLDLKPANIFWRRVGKGSFGAAIGDLGYIKSIENDFPVTSQHYAALGTLHYRSPEQKDFRDFCEVDIWPSENPQEIRLTTNDPKFVGTIVEPGDNLIFFNDMARSFQIEKILSKNINKGRLEDNITQITIKSLDHSSLNPDQKTQAVIYKKQGLRTDLFGFGAIVYDLVTAGKSPERFYNNLIVDDIPGTSITRIMDNYGHIKKRSRRDPKYSHIFEPFFGGGEKKYAPKEVVTLILKCMLYRARGTYFDTNKNNPFDDVLADVRELLDEYGGWDTTERNPLFSRAWRNYTETTPSIPNELREEILKRQDVARDINTNASFVRRVAWAAIRLTQLIRLVRQTLRFSMDDPEINDGRFYFFELAPENITILDERLGVGDRGYIFRKEFIVELLEDVVHERTILYDSTDPYSSFEHMGDIRRRVRLTPVGDPPNWRHGFLESSRIGDSVKKGDWIVVPGKCVAIIEMIDGDRLTLKPVEEKKGDEYQGFEEEIKNGETIFFRNLDPLGYCFSILGVYVYQLFFVGFAGNSISEPESVQSLKAQLKASPSLAENIRALLINVLDQPAYQEGTSCSENWRAVYCRITALYLALLLPDVHSVFMYKDSLEKEELLKKLVTMWEDNICRDIAQILDLPLSFFSDPMNLRSLSSSPELSDESGHWDEASQKMAEGIVSAANLVVHVRSILLAQLEQL